MPIPKILAAILFTASVLASCRDAASDRDASKEDSLYSGAKFNEHIRSTTALSPEEERKGFKLPPGFEINLFASEPQIGKPINLSFDNKGRMWVTQSFEYPFPAAPGTGKDRVTILEDTDGDGVADKFTHFSDTLNIPIGILPVHKGAMLFSIPNVYRFTDADNDGRADERKKLMGPFEVKDTHGMVNNFTWGFDGWVHACHGFSNRSTVAAADGDSIHLVSGNTIRFRPDGSRVEITTEGRINPFGLAFDELGYLYSTDCHTSPLYQLIRGGEYTQWGKEEKMGFAPDMKPLEDEATALAGIAYYADVLYPEEYQKNFYIGDAVASRVYRNSFSWKESTPVGKKEEEFVLSADPWFRPVDVKMGPDGAIYVADFYNSIIGHYEVPLDHPKRDKIRGRIWRITYKGKANKKNDLTIADAEQLLEAFRSANIHVRLGAANEIVQRAGASALPLVQRVLNNSTAAENEYVHALWVMQRLNALTDEMIEKALMHSSPVVRVHALRTIREQKDTSEALYPVIQKALNDKDPHVRRAAVEVIDRYVQMNSVEKLIAFRKSIPDYDSHMIYTAKLMLRNLLRNEKLLQQATARQWSEDEARILASVMVGVETPLSGQFIFNYVKNHAVDANDLPKVVKHIVRFVPVKQVGEVISLSKNKSGNNTTTASRVFTKLREGLTSRGMQEPPAFREWGKQVVKEIIEKDLRPSDRSSNEEAEQVHFAVQSAGTYKVAEVTHELEEILSDTAVRINIRNDALRSLMKLDPARGSQLAVKQLRDTTAIPAFRRNIVSVLSEFPGTDVNNALATVKNASPDLQQGIVMALAGSGQGREILFNKVRSGDVFARTLTDPRVKERLMLNISNTQKKIFDDLTAGLGEIDKEKQTIIRARISQYNSLAEKPLPAEGAPVFEKNCSPCHSMAGIGGAIGPQLDGVGRWGAEPLIEKILDPSRNIAENFRTYTLKLKDGKILSGLYRRDEGQAIVFADAAGREFAVSKQEIAERTPSKVSLMPDQFRNTIPEKEFYSLISYLLSRK